MKDFFEQLDRSWKPSSNHARQPLRLIGCGALMLQAKYERGTRDSDIFETHDFPPTVKSELLRVAGEGPSLPNAIACTWSSFRTAFSSFPRSLLAFEAAKDYWMFTAHADALPKYIENLHTVQRDFLGVDESEIELPESLMP